MKRKTAKPTTRRKTPRPGELAQVEYNKGVWYANNNRLRDSVRAYYKCLQLSPRNYKAMTNLGNVFWELGRNAEAVRLYHEAIRVKPTYVKAWTNLGHTFLTMGHWEPARAASLKAIKLDAEDSYAWNNLGYSLNELGRFGESIKALKKAVQLEDGSAEAHYNLGIAHLLGGHLKLACAEIDHLELLDDEYAMKLGEYISDWIAKEPKLMALAKKKKVPLDKPGWETGRR